MFAHIAAILRKLGREVLISFGSKFTNEPFSHGLRQHNRKQSTPSPIVRPPSPRKLKEGLEQLGKRKHQQAKSQWLTEGWQPRPGLRQLRPEDLPPDVTVSSGYDHRGHCYVFEHKKFAALGRIVFSQVRELQMLLVAEIYNGQEKPESATAKKNREIFEKVVATVSTCFG